MSQKMKRQLQSPPTTFFAKSFPPTEHRWGNALKSEPRTRDLGTHITDLVGDPSHVGVDLQVWQAEPLVEPRAIIDLANFLLGILGWDDVHHVWHNVHLGFGLLVGFFVQALWSSSHVLIKLRHKLLINLEEIIVLFMGCQWESDHFGPD